VKLYLPHFGRVARTVLPTLRPHQLEVASGSWLGSSALKVQKRAWTNAPGITEAGQSGIFFSVWVDEEAHKNRQVLYNIHALKLRNLPGYSIQSREFVAAFRARLARQKAIWPHISVDYGPQTLMQGWIALDDARLEQDVAKLINQFVPLAAVIDDLLEQRKVV
jgi:hypothetical protein